MLVDLWWDGEGGESRVHILRHSFSKIEDILEVSDLISEASPRAI